MSDFIEVKIDDKQLQQALNQKFNKRLIALNDPQSRELSIQNPV